MTITLLDGAKVDSTEIVFDSSSYHFFVGDTDVTNFIRRVDKNRLIRRFDVEKDNYRLSQEHPVSGGSSGLGTEPLNESTLFHLAEQLATDPLGAPIQTLDKAVAKALSSSGIRAIILAGLIGVGVLIYFKK